MSKSKSEPHYFYGRSGGEKALCAMPMLVNAVSIIPPNESSLSIVVNRLGIYIFPNITSGNLPDRINLIS